MQTVFNEAAYKRPPAAVPPREHEMSWPTAILITFLGTNNPKEIPMGSGVSRRLVANHNRDSRRQHSDQRLKAG